MKKENFFIIILIVSILIATPFVVMKLVKNHIDNDDVATLSETPNDNESTESASNIKIEEEQKAKDGAGESQPVSVKVASQQQSQKEYLPEQVDPEKLKNADLGNSLFIGDSRTVGLSLYGNLKDATFFANTGMSIYSLPKTKVQINGVGNVDLETLLSNHQYSKIYVMLGINEIGSNFDKTLTKYKEQIANIRSKQSNAKIYIEANLHVTAEKSKSHKNINNTNLNNYNAALSNIANGTDIFYLDVNEIFDDENGNLISSYTHDGVHIYAKYYKDWSNWIINNS